MVGILYTYSGPIFQIRFLDKITGRLVKFCHVRFLLG